MQIYLHSNVSPSLLSTKPVELHSHYEKLLEEDCAFLPVEEIPHKLHISFVECSEEINSRDLLQDTLVRSGVSMKNVMSCSERTLCRHDSQMLRC